MAPKEPHKYVRHSESQRTLILARAEELFVQRGVEHVTMSDLAAAAGMTRATLYRYYETKERVLWAIYNQQIDVFYRTFLPQLESQAGTTYERLAFYLHLLLDLYRKDPDSFRFWDVFFQTYQEATTQPGQKVYRDLHGDGFGTGDVVRLLTRNFHDGSVKPELDPVPTVVSLIYGTLILLLYLPKCSDSLSIKYGLSGWQLLEFHLEALLSSVRADTPRR